MDNYNNIMQVPKWEGYYPLIPRENDENSLIGGISISIPGNYANEEQLRFYYYFKKEFIKGNYVDVDGVIAYVFVFMYETIADYIDGVIDEGTIVNYLLLIKNNYGQYSKVNQYVKYWLGDIYYYLGDYEKAWDNRKMTSVETIINIKCKLDNKFLTGMELLELTALSSTLVGKIDNDILNNFEKYLDEYSRSFYKDKGMNLVEYKLLGLDYWSLDERYFEKYKDVLFTEKYLNWLIGNYNRGVKYHFENGIETINPKDKMRLFEGFPKLNYAKTDNIMFADYIEIPSILDLIIAKYLRKEFINIFNELFPKVRLISSSGRKSKLSYKKMN
ncbi:hypothetical protein [Clostridium sp. JNZ J1-5]